MMDNDGVDVEFGKRRRLDERGMCRVTTIDGINDYMF
jgi:hypothetical protein